MCIISLERIKSLNRQSVDLSSKKRRSAEQAPKSLLISDEESISLKVDAHSKVVANIWMRDHSRFARDNFGGNGFIWARKEFFVDFPEHDDSRRTLNQREDLELYSTISSG